MTLEEPVFSNYDGNGMFKSLGNIAVNPHVGLLFIQTSGPSRWLRVNGQAQICNIDPLMQSFAGAQLLIRACLCMIFSNFPCYIRDPATVTSS
ncbi:MAG: hypothetical protein EXR01_02125 [Acetobacteraceae bacterium]|nr:hypothetical protein [Acetobacteraceae bacterium]